MSQTRVVEKIKTFYIQQLFSENRKVYEIMSKNVMDTEGPQTTSQCGACALRAGLARQRARTRIHTPTRPGTHMHARKRTHAHKTNNQYL